MTDIVKINDTDVQVIEYQGQRVVTLAQADVVHGRPEGTAGRNFRKHKHRLIEGEDYFVVGSDEIRRNSPEAIPDALRRNDVILLAESGYLMLVKSFTDDLAWQVQRQLVNGYFRAKEASLQPAIPQNFAQALRLAADEHERRELAEAQRDEAIRTKALIGSKREASAMGKASAAVRQVKRLTEELGRNMRHATIIAVEKATGRKFGSQDWRPLRKFCKDKDLPVENVVDPRWGEVKAWPAEAWNAVYGIDLRAIFPPKGSA